MNRIAANLTFTHTLKTRIAGLQFTSNLAFARAINGANEVLARYLINRVTTLNERIECLKDQLKKM